MTLAFRILTYNVHGCVGVDRRHEPERIARVIESLSVDVAALQELDVEGRFGVDQARWLAERLQMSCLFVAARPSSDGWYGNAILSRVPLELVQNGALPCLPGREPRAAQWARLTLSGQRIDIVNTHFGLERKERIGQAQCLVGSGWTGGDRSADHTVLCGDLNALPRSRAVRQLLGHFRDASREAQRGRVRATWPSVLPLLRLDYVLTTRELEVREVSVPRRGLARVASDHLPLVAEIGLPG